MKLKQNLVVIALAILSFISFSCEENESGIDFVGFEARFVTDINDRTVSFINVSNDASTYTWDFGDGTTSEDLNPEKTYESYGTYTVTLTARNDNGDISTFQSDITLELNLIPVPVVNGDFENGSEGWIQGVDDSVPAPVVTDDDGNSFYQVNVTDPDPDQQFLVNLSQKLEIVQGNVYVLRFDAWSDGNRSIIAGIGLSGGDFTNNVQTVDITGTQTQYELTLNSFDFGAPDARILFDLNAEAGIVRIDNVSLFIQE